MKKSAHWPLMLPPSPQAQRLLCVPCLQETGASSRSHASRAGPGQPTKDHTDGSAPAACACGGPHASAPAINGACTCACSTRCGGDDPGFHALGHPLLAASAAEQSGHIRIRASPRAAAPAGRYRLPAAVIPFRYVCSSRVRLLHPIACPSVQQVSNTQHHAADGVLAVRRHSDVWRGLHRVVPV